MILRIEFTNFYNFYIWMQTQDVLGL